MQKQIVFVQDSVSISTGAVVISKLNEAGVNITKIGTIPIQVDSTENDITSLLESLVSFADITFGISSSGNGIAIYGNKIEGITAAQISSYADIEEAMFQQSCNLYDVSACNNEAASLFVEIAKKAGAI